MEIGRRIYYDKLTGAALVDTGQRRGDVESTVTTVEQDFTIYKALVDRVSDSVGVIQLDYDQHAEDFASASSYRVNPETEGLEFSFPDADPEAPQEPTYQAPLSTQVEQLQLALTDNYEQMLTAQQEATNAQMALADLYELTLSLQAEVTALKGGAS